MGENPPPKSSGTSRSASCSAKRCVFARIASGRRKHSATKSTHQYPKAAMAVPRATRNSVWGVAWSRAVALLRSQRWSGAWSSSTAAALCRHRSAAHAVDTTWLMLSRGLRCGRTIRYTRVMTPKPHAPTTETRRHPKTSSPVGTADATAAAKRARMRAQPTAYGCARTPKESSKTAWRWTLRSSLPCQNPDGRTKAEHEQHASPKYSL
mmetsp:Transcript_15679/g.48587  ORF Transcript_15679/g.48587 Transcript_15679/m.48587 type:complete len:209 (-) Transcript_15679:1341-1967(-)